MTIVKRTYAQRDACAHAGATITSPSFARDPPLPILYVPGRSPAFFTISSVAAGIRASYVRFDRLLPAEAPADAGSHKLLGVFARDRVSAASLCLFLRTFFRNNKIHE